MTVGEQIRNKARRNEAAIKKWKEAKELYEKYPKIVDALRSGEYLRQYVRTLEQIAKTYGEYK